MYSNLHFNMVWYSLTIIWRQNYQSHPRVWPIRHGPVPGLLLVGGCGDSPSPLTDHSGSQEEMICNPPVNSYKVIIATVISRKHKLFPDAVDHAGRFRLFLSVI